LANNAHADAATAYGQLAGETLTTDLSGQNLGGMTLTPGVYHFDTAAALNGTLTLDTGGDPNAAFHFQIGTTLTTGVASAITLLNGGSVNLFWQIGTSATIDVGSLFYGNILADQSITINSEATLIGRAIAINGAVTMDTNTVTAPVVPEPSTWFAGALTSGIVAFTERRRIRKFLLKLSGRGS
jgi:type VI secretion system secreted protein VgrG